MTFIHVARVLGLLLAAATAAPAFAESGLLTTGGRHSCRVTPQGGVECWGSNNAGQVGDGSSTNRPTPVPVTGLGSGVQSIAAGSSHTCALTIAGAVRCWGNNLNGQLGDGTTTTRFTSVPVTGLGSGVQSIAAGLSHTCARTNAGALHCWGNNFNGQLGDGTTTQQLTPVPVTGLGSGVQDVAAGDSHTCAVTATGAAQCWGLNINGQLGDATTTQRLTATPMTGLASGVQAIATGAAHTCALTGAGALHCSGKNTVGQLGDGTFAQRLTAVPVTGGSGAQSIAAGGDHTCALTIAGAARCWGRNFEGQVGDGTAMPRNTPVSVTGLGSGVQAIALGDFHTCALSTSGSVQCWGFNFEGQVGDGTISNRLTAVQVAGLGSGVQAIATGEFHTCAVNPVGALQCWGFNASGALGNGTTAGGIIPGTVTGLGSGIQATSAGGRHSCALTMTGALQCWGFNSTGQVGDGTTSQRIAPAPVTGLGSGVGAVAAGGNHTCAITAGALQCWGANAVGQLGDGSTTVRLTAVPVTGLGSGVQAVAAGTNHTCALSTTGAVQCWGDNTNGQLGDGSTTQRSTAVPVTGLGSGVQAIAAGTSHTCALTSLGGVQCWGLNTGGQLGDGTSTQRVTPVPVTGLGSGVQAIATGGGHTCALTNAGAVRCWGFNGSGQLGDGTTTQRLTSVPVFGLGSGVQAIATGGAHTCALSVAGGVQCWGRGDSGQLGNPDVVATTPRQVHLPGSGVLTPGISFVPPPGATAEDFTGSSVAIGEGDSSETIVVGAPGTDAGGAVYLYVRSSGSPTSAPVSEKGLVVESFGKNIAPAVTLPPPPGGSFGDKWGAAVATSPDGTSIAVGAPLRSGGGRVFVFRMPDGGWEAGLPDTPLEILPPAPAGGITPSEFGDRLSYGADGTLIVGAPGTDIGASTDAGAAYAYLDNGKTVVPLAGGTLSATTAQANARFGAAVATDDGVVAVGAPNENAGALTQQGAAYVFSATGGNVGSGTQILPVGGALGDKFGTGIAVSDGTVIVGAPGDDTTAGVDSGSARVFRPGIGGIYGQVSILLPGTGDDQGAGTAVAARPGTILLGAPLADAGDKIAAGSAYLYQEEDLALGTTETADATLLNPFPDTGDLFGSAVAIGTRRLLIGVPGDTEPDSTGTLRPDIGRTDTFILDRIHRSGFE